MASHRVGEIGLSESEPANHNFPYGILHGMDAPSTSFMDEQGAALDYRELEEAIVLHGVTIKNGEAKSPLFAARPAATLEMFPSWPIRFQQTPRESSRSGGENSDSGAANTVSSKTEAQLEPESPISMKATSSGREALNQNQLKLQQLKQQVQQELVHDNSRMATSPYQSAAKVPQEKRKEGGSTSSNKQLDVKTLRRLAQNREAARKSRLRKKAYVQQLESSRMKLTQLEQDLQRARSQGLFLGCGSTAGNISSGAAIFDMEYQRWLEDDHRHLAELRTGLNALPDCELRLVVDGYLSHFDEIFRLKAIAAKSDVFHVITGIWTTPAERCFLWMGGFRPSELIKMLIQQLEPLAEQQIVGIYSLQQSSQQAEDALSQGLEQLRQSLVDTVAGGPVIDGVQQMVVATSKLANLEGFVRQGDNLRQQTLHQLHRILTVRQTARCFLVIGEYYGRLRVLSSVWTSRPREAMLSDDYSFQTRTDLQTIPSLQHHFTNF